MYDVYEFSSVELTKILYEELIRRGKKLPDRCGVTVTFSHSILGQMKSAQVKITEPIPGAAEI